VAKARSFIKSLAKFGYKQEMKEFFFKEFFATSWQPNIEFLNFLIEDSNFGNQRRPKLLFHIFI
jgi:hypothetical protein